MSNEQRPIIEVTNLCKHFASDRGGRLHAVDDISMTIRPGETVGLVGESGCGKTTLGRILVRMIDQSEGSYRFEGREVPGKLSRIQRRQFSRKVQMVFQDPYASLDPRMTAANLIAEGPEIHGLWQPFERSERVRHWLNRVGLRAEQASWFPHEFSGGQRQRIAIARALAIEPQFVVCDEPISALDVSVQAQIIMLLRQLQEESGLTYLFIAHGLHMVRYVACRTAVMYLGRLVEIGPSGPVFSRSYHPYTEALVAANPYPDPRFERKRRRQILRGEVNTNLNRNPGCCFAERCPLAVDRCREAAPRLREIAPGHKVACHLR